MLVGYASVYVCVLAFYCLDNATGDGSSGGIWVALRHLFTPLSGGFVPASRAFIATTGLFFTASRASDVNVGIDRAGVELVAVKGVAIETRYCCLLLLLLSVNKGEPWE